MLTLFFLVLFVLHWQVSVFLQTFFLHRYGAHRQFTMSKGWERIFHVLTFVDPGPELPEPARLRDHAPHAPRVQRHADGSALADAPAELLHDDVADQDPSTKT